MPYRDGLAAARRRLTALHGAFEPRRAKLTPALRRALPAIMRDELEDLERALAGPHATLDAVQAAEQLIDCYGIALTVACDLAPARRRRQLSRRGLLAGAVALAAAGTAAAAWYGPAPRLHGWPLGRIVAAGLKIDNFHLRRAERAVRDRRAAVVTLRSPIDRHPAGWFDLDLTLFNPGDEHEWFLLSRSAVRGLPSNLAFLAAEQRVRRGRERLSRPARQLEIAGGEHEALAVRLEPHSAITIAGYRVGSYYAPWRLDLAVTGKLWVEGDGQRRSPGGAHEVLAPAIYGDVVAWRGALPVGRCDACAG